MARIEEVQALVDGGKASGGPPIGPALGPTGVNIYQVVQKINEETSMYAGLKVPVTIRVNVDTKEFEILVHTPPTSALILKELEVEKGSSNPLENKIGDLSIDQVIKIVKTKRETLLAIDLKNATKEILGTCNSMGVTVEGKDPRIVQKEIDEGEFDSLFD